MSAREKYRRTAQAILTQAETIHEPGERAVMLSIAQLYLRLADRVGARRERATAHRATADKHH